MTRIPGSFRLDSYRAIRALLAAPVSRRARRRQLEGLRKRVAIALQAAEFAFDPADMDPRILYESPFTDIDPLGVAKTPTSCNSFRF